MENLIHGVFYISCGAEWVGCQITQSSQSNRRMTMNAYSFHTFNSLQMVQSKAIVRKNHESLRNAEEPVVSVLEQLKLALWVEVVTEQPNAPTTLDLLYVRQLKTASGYIEDLKQESAQVIAVTFNRVQPRS